MHASAPDWMSHPTCALGTITPSGNTVVERVTLGVLRHLPQVAAHFSRTPVFGSADPSPDAYRSEGLLAAAALLAHCKPDLLVWNGSKGAGIGFEHDRRLVADIEQATGIRATTSILGLAAWAASRRVSEFAVVTPYGDAGHAQVLRCLRGEGYAVSADHHLGLSDNLSYASVPLETVAAQVREVAVARPQAVLCLCTNYPAAAVAAALEAELGLPVIDSTALGVWHALRLMQVDTTPAAAAWGSLFSCTP